MFNKHNNIHFLCYSILLAVQEDKSGRKFFTYLCSLLVIVRVFFCRSNFFLSFFHFFFVSAILNMRMSRFEGSLACLYWLLFAYFNLVDIVSIYNEYCLTILEMSCQSFHISKDYALVTGRHSDLGNVLVYWLYQPRVRMVCHHLAVKSRT